MGVHPKFEAPTGIMGLDQFTEEEIRFALDNMTEDERRDFDALLRNSPPRALMYHQIVPVHLTWWEVYLLIGGRGTGKTVAGATETRNHLRRFKKGARIGIGAPTNADARDTCMEGETGLITMFPNEFTDYNRSLGEARHIDGGVVKAMGTEQAKRWNGPQWSMLWFDELALCNPDSWNDANLGLRLGEHPYAVCTTTPKNKKWVKKLALDKTTYVPQYIGDNGKRRLPTTFDNKYLPQRRVNWLKDKYGGSRLGRQELEGIFIDDVAGARWNRKWFRWILDDSKWPPFVRIVVAIDPAGSPARRVADDNQLTDDQKNNHEKNAQTAIAVCGLGVDGQFYLLACKADWWTPTEWAIEAIKLYHKFMADKIVAESNFGGGMVESNIMNIKQIDPDTGRLLNGKNLPIQLVTASRGKHIRAEPVATLYEQGRVYHLGNFTDAEDQMCAFIDADDNDGADMVDAVVWGFTELAGLDADGQSVIILPGDPRYNAFVVM